MVNPQNLPNGKITLSDANSKPTLATALQELSNGVENTNQMSEILNERLADTRSLKRLFLNETDLAPN